MVVGPDALAAWSAAWPCDSIAVKAKQAAAAASHLVATVAEAGFLLLDKSATLRTIANAKATKGCRRSRRKLWDAARFVPHFLHTAHRGVVAGQLCRFERPSDENWGPPAATVTHRAKQGQPALLRRRKGDTSHATAMERSPALHACTRQSGVRFFPYVVKAHGAPRQPLPEQAHKFALLAGAFCSIQRLVLLQQPPQFRDRQLLKWQWRLGRGFGRWRGRC